MTMNASKSERPEMSSRVEGLTDIIYVNYTVCELYLYPDIYHQLC